MLTAKNNEGIAAKYEESLRKDEALASNEEQSASLQADLENSRKQQEKFMASKDKKIASLEADLKNSKPVNDTMGLISGDNENKKSLPTQRALP